MQIAKRLLGIAGGPSGLARHQCLCCGRCCESFGGHLNASRADLARWRSLGRTDLLRRVSAIGWIWIDPETGLLEPSCPFLERVGPDRQICRINEVKPDMCRDYPTLAHGRQCLRGVFLGWAALCAEAAEIAEIALGAGALG
jgi:Fe-S-cluster containining protein